MVAVAGASGRPPDVAATVVQFRLVADHSHAAHSPTLPLTMEHVVDYQACAMPNGAPLFCTHIAG